MKRNSLFLIVFFVIIFAFSAESQSQAYKYVDEKGVTHFTNVPADRRYRPASQLIERKAPKKHKDVKPKRHFELIPPKNVKRLNPQGPSN
jgi:lactam utilization protein B